MASHQQITVFSAGLYYPQGYNCLKKRSNGLCQGSIGALSRDAILLQSKRLFKGLAAGLEKSLLLQATGSTSIESLSKMNFAIPCLLTKPEFAK